MLSESTEAFLAALSRTSDSAYPEGGTVWTYTEAANLAHARFRDSHRRVAAGPLDVEQLGRLLQWARGERSPTTAHSIESASSLIALLREDLRFDEMLWSFEDGGTDMTASLYMARTSDNRFFSLELFRSED